MGFERSKTPRKSSSYVEHQESPGKAGGLSAGIVFVTEGEKSADAAAHLFPDLIAVSPMNGAKSPAKADWAPFAGRHVVIWPDHDESGEAFRQAVPAL